MPSSLPSANRVLTWRQRRAAQARSSPAPRLGLLVAGSLALLLPLLFLGAGLYYTWLSADLPSIEKLPALIEPPGGVFQQPTRLYDRSGEHLLLALENPAAAGRRYLRVSSDPEETGPVFSPALIMATLASRDPDFWERNGNPWLEFIPVELSSSGSPTLAQQVVSGLLFDEEPASLNRDLRIRLLAAQVTGRYGSEKILEWYLNTADYGSLAFGADAAARVYFGKSAADLDFGEAAILAAVAQAPVLNPLDAPDAAAERGRQVLQEMQRLGWITSYQATALDQPPEFRKAVPDTTDPAPAFTRLVLEQLEAQISRTRLVRGGLIIRTSLDLDLQLQVNCALAEQLNRLSFTATEKPAQEDSVCPAANLLPTQPVDQEELPAPLAANAVVYDPQTGEILALAGSEDGQLTRRPAGTLLTPFVYLTAFTRGMSPGTLVWDIPSQDAGLAVENFDGEFHGPLRLRTALANDYLAPVPQLLNQVGSGNVWRMAGQLGLSGLVLEGSEEDPMLPVYTGQASLMELVQAYGVLANSGNLAGIERPGADESQAGLPLEPMAVLAVETITGEVLLERGESQTRPLLTPPLAYLLTHSLSDEAARWPSLGHPNSLEIGRPAAAKLGRTIDGQDAWAIGYTPQRVAGVWIGAINEESEEGKQVPAGLAAGLWHAILQYATSNLPPLGWEVPQGVTSVTVCDPSGMLPTEDCPTRVNEVFLQGSEPTHRDTLYQRVAVNRLSGQLATLFTPADLVEERVVINPPVEARDWARAAGLAIAPETYDLVPADPEQSSSALISSPDMFTYVRGEVEIRGQAGGEAFDFYRVQVGEGLNPRQWVQLGSDTTRSVKNGTLATWDTTGLEGLYAIQLLVIDQEQRVRKSTIFVSVDNTPPEVRVLSPHQGQLLAPEERRITLRAAAEDDLSIDRVEFFLDGNPLHTLNQPPFAIQWTAKPGEHTLEVVAVDAAGNTAETASEFTIE